MRKNRKSTVKRTNNGYSLLKEMAALKKHLTENWKEILPSDKREIKRGLQYQLLGGLTPVKERAVRGTLSLLRGI